MAHYNIYRDRVATTHPAFGHCMPSESLGRTEGMAVRIGDIGYASEGKFPHRLYLLSSGDASHVGISLPESHERACVHALAASGISERAGC
jgi:hypothetical protein